MKAIVCAKYVSPEVIRIKEFKKPIPKDNEVLIRVYAASINSYDWRIMRGKPFMVRLIKGLFKPRAILGADFAGTVETVGREAKKFKAGDEVYGDLSASDGAFAEYVCAPENVLALKPSGATFEEAASVPMAACTALTGLRDTGKIKAGHKVLINGASGGVGTFAVQIAKSFGAEVTAVCSTGKMDVAFSIGADYVIDYTREDYTKNGQHYDLILDIAANHSISELKQVLKPKGICAVVGFSTMANMLKTALWGGKRISMVLAKPNSDDLLFMNKLLETGKVKPVIDRCYSLDETAEAFRYFENRLVKGKVIISQKRHIQPERYV
jgi:NADPH:quinone reductase-like Zn-dependent oxidoreductase